VGALFAKTPIGPHTDLESVELALDLTSEAVTVYERNLHGGWKKFASALLDDPEFSIMIGLLRAEAESHAGSARPVRLWLPGEQVLMLRTRLKGKTPVARRQAAFDYIARETSYRPNDVALAISLPDPKGETTVLITYAETWREARDYAARWGFIPGDVSTRHNAADFGSEGPVFLLDSPMPTPMPIVTAAVPEKHNFVAFAAIAVIALAAGFAVWEFQPWESPSNFLEPVPGTTIEIAETPSLDEPPETVGADPIQTPGPEMTADLAPPDYSTQILAPSPPDTRDLLPVMVSALMVVETPAPPDSPTAPVPEGPAPVALPTPEPAPLERDIVAAWMGPVPEIQPRDLSSPLAAKEISKATEPLVRIKKVALLSNGKIPPQQRLAAPVLVPPPAEPAPEAEDATQVESPFAPVNVPIPPPRLARADPADKVIKPIVDNPLASILPPPRPIGLGKPAPDTIAAVPAANSVETAPIAPAEAPNLVPATPNEAQKTDPPTKYASLTSPMPRTRPAHSVIPRELPSIAALPTVKGTTKPSIRAAATQQGLPLDNTALIGILNMNDGRKALLRFANGRYRSVVVGDELDGWRVSIIGKDAMRVTRAGEDRTLLLVNR
jgi:hypothetical protein